MESFRRLRRSACQARTILRTPQAASGTFEPQLRGRHEDQVSVCAADRLPGGSDRLACAGAESSPGDEIPEKYRETVHKGLEYLVKSQCQDGHWEGEGGQHPVAMTGLAGLALFMERRSDAGRAHDPNRKYTANIRKAVDWLMDKSQAGLTDSFSPSTLPKRPDTCRAMVWPRFSWPALTRPIDANRTQSSESSHQRSSTSSTPSRPRAAGTTHPRWKATIST